MDISPKTPPSGYAVLAQSQKHVASPWLQLELTGGGPDPAGAGGGYGGLGEGGGTGGGGGRRVMGGT